MAAHAVTSDVVVPPLGLCMTANCLPLLRAAHNDDAAGWVSRAIDALEVALGRELAEQFGELYQSIVELVAEGFDHDLLLV
jgi:hypothetical protein